MYYNILLEIMHLLGDFLPFRILFLFLTGVFIYSTKRGKEDLICLRRSIGLGSQSFSFESLPCSRMTLGKSCGKENGQDEAGASCRLGHLVFSVQIWRQNVLTVVTVLLLALLLREKS